MKLKSIATLTALSLIGMTGMMGCQKAAKKAESGNNDIPSAGAAATPVAPLGPAIEVLAAKGESKVLAKPLTSTGENSDARFSHDGQRILYVSRMRSTHKQAQVYELHLGLMKEKRITFHDGDDSAPLYMPDGQHFIFSSGTDEIKEDPYVSDRLMKTYYRDGFDQRAKSRGQEIGDGANASELYLQTLNGRTIERLTKSPGFDGDADVDAKGKHIVFSSATPNDALGTSLYLLSGKSRLRLTEGKFVDRAARFSPDGRWMVWTRQSLIPKSDEMHVMLADLGASADPGDFKKAKALTSGANMDLHPSFHPTGDEIVFSSNRGDGKFFNLYTVNRAGDCIRRLTDGDFDQVQPVFSPDGKRILFTARRDGHLHIYMMDYQKPAECIQNKAAPATTQTPTSAPTASPAPTTAPTPSPAPTAAASPPPTATPLPH